MTISWQPLPELPDLRRVGIIALDTETKDDGLRADRGSAWPWRGGHVAGISIAYRADGRIRSHYFPLRHPETANFDPEQVFAWLKDLVASDVRFVTQNGLYDWGWLRADGGVSMPPSARLEEVGALATLVDENRFTYSLDALCTWRGLPGKDETLLNKAAVAGGFKPNEIKQNIHLLPARYVGPYAEADAASTLALWESLDPVLDQEGTRDAYRLEIDLLPMVLEMRRRGIRIDQAAAEHARDEILQKRDVSLAELSEKLGTSVGMEEIASPKWKAQTFDAHSIKYPHTEKGNPSFKAGKTGWMPTHPHWLPQLIAKAARYDAAGTKFLEGHILAHTINGRIHAEIHPHRSDEGGTRSLRFSYSDPPLQQMPARDKELSPLVRGVFLPEEGQVWAKPDISQQEFRFVVHHALLRKLPQAAQAAELYHTNPDADFHGIVASMTGIERESAKVVNFAKIFGAGVKKFAEMIGKPLSEAQAIYAKYDQRLPFVTRLSGLCEREAKRLGYTVLYDGARRHWNYFEAPGVYVKGAGPCPLEEARRRKNDAEHPWHGKWLRQHNVHTAMNALIQGSAARHTKLWMRACWREGIVPLLQMHDALDCSVTTREQGELVARLGCEAVQLAVPMRVDLKFGKSWGDAKHEWDDLNETAQPAVLPEQDSATTSVEAIAPLSHGGEAAAPEGVSPAPPKPAIIAGCVPGYLDGANNAPAVISEASARPGNGYASDKREWGRIEAEYIYRDSDGNPHTLARKWRHPDGGKSFSQHHLENGRWVKNKPAGPKIPYRLPELIAAAPDVPVFVCEGEKDADNVAALGLIATTNSEGAGKCSADLSKWFVGKQRVYIPEDNDDAGRGHAAKVASSLQGIVPNIYIVSFPELIKPKKDVSDWLALGHTKEQLLARAEVAPKAVVARLHSCRASHIKMRSLQWLWKWRIAVGALNVLAGLPDKGKGLTWADIVGRITTGGLWPAGEGKAPKGNVLIFSAEDDTARTVVPRLAAAGADLDCVEIVEMMANPDGSERMFNLVTDMPALKAKLEEIGDVALVVIDPVAAYLGVGKVAAGSNTDVRGVLTPLTKLAEEKQVAILAIMHFNKKAEITNAVLRIADSIAYTAVGCSIYVAVDDPDNENAFLFIKAKNNLAPRDLPALRYSIGGTKTVGFDEELNKPIEAPFIVWDENGVQITALEAMEAAAGGSRGNAKDEAEEFLRSRLVNGPVPADEIYAEAKAQCIAIATLRRAKHDLNIISEKAHGTTKGGWCWRLAR